MSTSRKRQAPSRSSRGASSSSGKPPVDYVVKISHSTHRDRYKSLCQNERKIKSTKFIHRPSLETLGCLDGVVALFRNIGWEDFLRRRARTYVTPTREFIATYSHDQNTRTINFQMLNVQRTLSYSQINAIMGTPTDDILATNPLIASRDFNDQLFWYQITGTSPYTSANSKASNIIHPCLRLAHRILNSTIFGRKEVGQVSRVELLILWAMTRPNAPRVDFANYFTSKCRSIIEVETTDIHIGGLITLLATQPPLSLTIESPPFEEAEGPRVLDLEAFSRMHMIREDLPRGYIWFHTANREELLTLPHLFVGAFDPHNPETWLLPPDDMEPEPEPEQEPIPQQPQFQQFPPNFFENFEAMRLDMQHVRQRNDAMYDRVDAMYNWHLSQHHFPPPDPPM